jgi:hypothetical protein
LKIRLHRDRIPIAGRVAGRHLDRLLEQLRPCGDVPDEPHVECLLRRVGSPLEQHLKRTRRADQLHETLRSDRGREADQQLGQDDRDLSGRDPDVEADRHLDPATATRAVDRRDPHRRGAHDPQHHIVEPAHVKDPRYRRRLDHATAAGDALHRLDVAHQRPHP